MKESYEIEGNQDKALYTRIEELEKLVEERRNYIESMERKEPMQTGDSNPEEVQKLKLDIQKLNKEIDSLVATVAGYEQRLGKGDYNPQTTKVCENVDIIY